MTVRLVRPSLTFGVHEDGTLEVISAWFPLITLGQAVLDRADGTRMVIRGDELTFRCSNGEATYTLGPAAVDGQRSARLLHARGGPC